ncbi:hypothetical protein GCK32_011594 [Trichostrongylus colubriformis]|uniref:Uncharacterized protein n=1 Tax=Trichostrongylus colubriformis TaxID=6319 RepID=A0AAN8FEY2_TRICO
MHLCTLSLACCVLLFAQGYADQGYTFTPVIPEEEIDEPKIYQDVLLRVINKFRPDNEKPMKYNHQLERIARKMYSKKGRETPNTFNGELYRFDAGMKISEEEFYRKPRKAFKTALKAVEQDVTMMWDLSSFYQIGCHVGLTKRVHLLSDMHILWLCRGFTRKQCDK